MQVRKARGDAPQWLTDVAMRSVAKEEEVGNSTPAGLMEADGGEAFEPDADEIRLAMTPPPTPTNDGDGTLPFKTAEKPYIEVPQVEEKVSPDWEHLSSAKRASHGFQVDDMYAGSRVASAVAANLSIVGGKDGMVGARPTIASPNIIAERQSAMAIREAEVAEISAKNDEVTERERFAWETNAASALANKRLPSAASMRIGSDIGSGNASRVPRGSESLIHGIREIAADTGDSIREHNEKSKVALQRKADSDRPWETVSSPKTSKGLQDALFSSLFEKGK
jgi:hypothetical protein